METIYTIIGMMQGIFTDSKTGKEVKYGRVYATYDPADSDGQIYDGQAAEIFKVNPDLVGTVDVGDKVRVYYNKFGKVQDFVKIAE